MKRVFFIALLSATAFATLETSELKRAQAYAYEQAKNPTKAFQLYQEAFLEDNTNTRAIHDLALCYKEGYGTKPNEELYIFLMQKAADFGSPKAMLRMAEIYGAEKFELALYWMAQAAQSRYSETAEDKRMIQGAQQDLYRNLKRFKKFSLQKKELALKYKGLHIDAIDLNHQAQIAFPRTRIILTTPTAMAVLPQNNDSRTPMTAILTFLKKEHSLEVLKGLIAGAENGQLESQLELYRLLQNHIESPEQFSELVEIDIILVRQDFVVKGIRLLHASKRASKEKAFAM